MITTGQGNLLTADVDALVNTVNTVGVMGKGIALQFRRAYPEMFTAYARAAKAGEVELGRMYVWPAHALNGPRYVINFPTSRTGGRPRDCGTSWPGSRTWCRSCNGWTSDRSPSPRSAAATAG